MFVTFFFATALMIGVAGAVIFIMFTTINNHFVAMISGLLDLNDSSKVVLSLGVYVIQILVYLELIKWALGVESLLLGIVQDENSFH